MAATTTFNQVIGNKTVKLDDAMDRVRLSGTRAIAQQKMVVVVNPDGEAMDRTLVGVQVRAIALCRPQQASSQAWKSRGANSTCTNLDVESTECIDKSCHSPMSKVESADTSAHGMLSEDPCISG